MKEELYDLIIIGGGPAGISAGIYAARKKLKTILIVQDWGGQASKAPVIENYPGFESILGLELVEKLVAHLKKNDLVIKEGLEVKKITTEDLVVQVGFNDQETIKGRALIIATGSHYKKLGLANEEKLVGKGISYCSTCDAPLYRDKAVAVIGGGNAGLVTVLALLPYAAQVYLLEYMPRLTGHEIYQEKISQAKKVKVLTNVVVKEIKGIDFVQGLVYQDRASKELRNLRVEGVFIAIGSQPNSALFQGLVELNEKGEIKINQQNQTSRENIFAAGDVTDLGYKQMIVAAGEGAKAALAAYHYLKSQAKE